ncbi:FMN-linked oxidoreductase [Hypoxylon trugodes]|uniref:FMN-linked oxidoreductase n=1 Tax=Hypoxylon trugodes TaxID=326681 RepID=UPI0021903B0D|nr:FMN-linked oxidoreductase [Hypoxylon trugodes]KAI1393141.1 FMN-linked oxidoreductase [Hypoxylon trugodes]
MAQSSRLFQPLKVGNATLQHRLVMAPLTRYRSDENGVPLPFVKEYYGQRASVPGTLLITEATYASKRGAGYLYTPGIWSKEQIAGWKEVTDAVHAKGSYIFVQLWALGRVATPETIKSLGFDLVSASNIPSEEGKPVPRELTVDEIQSFVADFAQAARNAVEAGFDGVEIHGANGYLIDQFIQDVSNKRNDQYGGSIENRARFALEIANAVTGAIGSDRVGIRLSPWSQFQGMRMADPIPQFTYLIKELSKVKLAYLHVVQSHDMLSSNPEASADFKASEQLSFAVKAWDNTSPVLIAGGYAPDTAKKLVDEVFKDNDVAVVFGRFFISTPDLPFRIKKGLPLAKYDRSTFYAAGSTKGYIDYPFSEDFAQAA